VFKRAHRPILSQVTPYITYFFTFTLVLGLRSGIFSGFPAKILYLHDPPLWSFWTWSS